MVQWINVLWNNSFINPMKLPLLCEKTGALAIVKMGFMAGWQAGKPLGRQKCYKVRNLKFCIFDF